MAFLHELPFQRFCRLYYYYPYHFCDVQKHIIDLDYQCCTDNILMPPQTESFVPRMSKSSSKKISNPTIPKSPRILKSNANVKLSTGQFKNNDMDNNSITYKNVGMEVHEGKELYECLICYEQFHNVYDVQKHHLDLNYECFLENFLMPPLTNMGVTVLQEVEISRQQDYPEAIKTGTKDSTNKKQYKCSKCSGIFLTQYNLNRHIASDHEGIKRLIASVHEEKKKMFNTSVHQGKKPLKCGICDNFFSDEGDLKKHIESAHEKKVPFKCEICYYSSSRKDYLKKHIESVHEKKELFKCNICDYSCSQKDFLKKHIESVHEKKKLFKCDICDYSCFLKHDMKKHFESVHEKRKQFKCNICDYSCYHKCNMKKHVESVHEKKEPFQCDICDYKCYQKGSMTEHVESAHEKMKKSFNCNTCKIIFQRKDKFEKHVNIYHKEKWFPCELCEAHFGFKTLLIKHEMKNHDLKGPFPCKFCKETFATNGERNLHQLRCKDPSKYPFVCRICYARFALKKSATVHEKNKNIHPSLDKACVSMGASGTSNLV